MSSFEQVSRNGSRLHFWYLRPWLSGTFFGFARRCWKRSWSCSVSLKIPLREFSGHAKDAAADSAPPNPKTHTTIHRFALSAGETEKTCRV